MSRSKKILKNKLALFSSNDYYHIRFMDYGITLIATLLVVAANIFAYRLASIYLGTEGFSKYAIIRRTLSLLLPILCFGIGVALPRYLAKMEQLHGKSNIGSYFLAAIALVFPLMIIMVVVINIFPEVFAYMIFGNKKYANLMPPISCRMFALGLATLCYSYFRGRLFMRLAGLFQIIVHAVIPIVAFYLFSGKLTSLFWWMGGLSAIFSLAIMAYIMATLRIYEKKITSIIGELFSYGIRRLPGDFAIGGLFTFPSLFATHYVGLNEAGMIAFGTTLTTLAVTAISPFSVILLPFSTKLLEAGELPYLRKQIHKILWIGTSFSFIGILVGELLASIGVRFWLGPEYLDSVVIIRIIILGIFPYSIYICLRSVLDAAFTKAINARNSYIALAFFLITFGAGLPFGRGIFLVLVPFLIGVSFLGSLTFIETYKFLKTSQQHTRIDEKV